MENFYRILYLTKCIPVFYDNLKLTGTWTPTREDSEVDLVMMCNRFDSQNKKLK